MSQPGSSLVVDHQEAYVLGFPGNVAVTVRNDDPAGWLTNLPVASTLRTYGAVGIELSTPGGQAPIHKKLPKGFVAPDSREPKFKLAPGESRRLLFDLFELLPAAVAAGSYQAVLLHGDLTQRTESAPFSFTLRAPSPLEQLELDSLRPEVEAHRSWGQWTMMSPSEQEKVSLPTSKADPLRYNKIIRYFLFSPQDLKHIPLTCLDVLDGLFAPEAAALKAELLAARDMGAFRNQAFHVRQKYPGLSYWMAEIEARQSAFAWARGNR